MKIFFDVDYTILGLDNSLRPQTKETFQALLDEDHQIYIWSGMGERWEVIEKHQLQPFVSGVYEKPTHHFHERLEELGVPFEPDFVIDDYPEVVAAFRRSLGATLFLQALSRQGNGARVPHRAGLCRYRNVRRQAIPCQRYHRTPLLVQLRRWAMPIRILPPVLANRIAAGEVVERPVSVVKELLENSIDSGASQILVEIRAGGVELIRVSDDGAGIPSEEVALAFHRHATSKLDSEEQLDSVATMGFRGEALPSVAAVSQVTIQTRPLSETAGYRMVLHWGEPVESGSEGCAPGTVIEVSQLFGNQPARRKFLRSAQAETARVQELVSRYALVFPEVRFRLVNDGRASLTTPGNGQPREALLAVYGSQVAGSMLEVQAEDTPFNSPPQEGNAGGAYAVEGYVGAPSVSRANRTYMTFFVNRRLIQSRMLAFAVEEAYAGLLQTKRYPVAAINVVMPYDEVDVNSHPAKREVRFHNEGRVFSLVQRAVRAALVAESPVPAFAPNLGESAYFGGFRSGSRASGCGACGLWWRDCQAAGEDRQSMRRGGAVVAGPPRRAAAGGGAVETNLHRGGGAGGDVLGGPARAPTSGWCSTASSPPVPSLSKGGAMQDAVSQPLLAAVSVELTPSHATTLARQSGSNHRLRVRRGAFRRTDVPAAGSFRQC